MNHIMTEEKQYRELFNIIIGDTISHAIRIIQADPSLLIPGTAILHYQRKAARIRRKYDEKGILVPSVLIVSITSRCNLSCAGCYMRGRHNLPDGEMNPETLSSIIDQATEMGISIIVIAGGEPLVRYEEIIRIAQKYPHMLFPVFTNGLLIDEKMAENFGRHRNIVPMISFEGFRDDTDTRRGTGVYDRLLTVCSLLVSQNVFFGSSLTTSCENFTHVTSETFIRKMMDMGIRVFSFVEYVPMTEDTEYLMLTVEQKKNLQIILSRLNETFPALFIGFPGDEDQYGGCLAAGRGFLHISPSGDIEPCPAVSYSDANLKDLPLEKALQSRLLARIRENPEVLTESTGGCALRANLVWVEEILKKN